MSVYTELIPIPSVDSINSGLSAAKPSTMLDIFGPPGKLTTDCSSPSGDISELIVHESVGPFNVSGCVWAVRSLRAALSEIRVSNPDLYGMLGTAGMLCVRAVRGSTTRFSNHSFGCAIDFTVGGILTEQGAQQIPRGLMTVYHHMRAHGWFWGAGYHGGSKSDPMHFEVADETIRRLASQNGW